MAGRLGVLGRRGRRRGVVFLLLAALHAVSLALDARTRLSALSRGGTVLFCVVALAGADALL